MNRVLRSSVLMGVVLSMVSTMSWAQMPANKPKITENKLGITDIEVTKGVKDSCIAEGRGNSLDRVVEAINGQLISAFSDTNKYEIVAWKDLAKIVDVASANQSMGGGTAFSYAGCKYSVQVTIDDFQDVQREVPIPELNERHLQRFVRLSGVVKIYLTEDGSLYKTSNVQLDLPPSAEPKDGMNGQKLTDALLIRATRTFSEFSVWRITDILFPMKVVAKSDKVVTLSRGDGFKYQPGMVFDVFAVGEELIDPDTGKSLGKAEEKIGRVRVIAVLPNVTRAEVLEDRGIDRGAIARLPEGPQTPTGPQGGGPLPR